jgi:hypothetical protein
VVFLAKFAPTLRQDSLRLKIVFNWISKGGAEEDEAPGVRGETIPFSQILSYNCSYLVLAIRERTCLPV